MIHLIWEEFPTKKVTCFEKLFKTKMNVRKLDLKVKTKVDKSLKKVSLSEMPEYLNKNAAKYSKWLEN